MNLRAPKTKTTIRISASLGSASQYADSPMTVVELKGRTPQEKGDHYLQLSLGALKELAALLEDTRLSEGEKTAYNKAYNSSLAQYDATVRLRDRLLAQKKSFRRILVNLFVRESEASRFLNTTYWNYSSIRRTSDELHRRLLPVIASGSVPESPRDVVEGSVLVKDLPPNETLQGINLDVHGEQEENEAFAIFNRIGTLAGADVEDEDDDSATVTQSWPLSPSPSCTVIYNINNVNNSVLSFDSEVTGAAIIVGMNEGAAAATHLDPFHADTNQHK